MFSTSSGTIRNLGLVNWSVTASGAQVDVGGLVGSNTGTVTNDYITGTGTVASTTATAFTAASGVGGLVGINTGTITSSHSTVNVSAKANGSSATHVLGVGGLVGYDNGGTIQSSYATGNETDTGGGTRTFGGGFIGVLNSGAIEADFALGTATVTGGTNGAFAGQFGGTYTNDAVTLSAVANTKTYNGTTSAAATPTLSGSVKSGDTVSASETYATQNAGTGLTLSVSSGYSIAYGSASTNYYYTVTTATNTSGVINKLPVSLSGARTYDGTIAASSSILSVTNLVSGDNLTLSGSAALASKNAGTDSISAAGTLSLGGTSAGNYTVTGLSGSVTVGKAALTLTAQANSKTYDATNTAAATPSICRPSDRRHRHEPQRILRHGQCRQRADAVGQWRLRRH